MLARSSLTRTQQARKRDPRHPRRAVHPPPMPCSLPAARAHAHHRARVCATLPLLGVLVRPCAEQCIWELARQHGAVTMMADEIHDGCQSPYAAAPGRATRAARTEHPPEQAPCAGLLATHATSARRRALPNTLPNTEAGRRRSSRSRSRRGRCRRAACPTTPSGASSARRTCRRAAGRRAASSTPAGGSASAAHRPGHTYSGPALSTVAQPQATQGLNAPGVGLAQLPSPTGAHVA